MSTADAQAYLEQFLQQSDGLIERLRSDAERAGGPRREELDFSRESLVPLWTWVLPQLRWREGYVPPGPDGIPRTRYRLDDLQPVDKLPSWFFFPNGYGLETFAPQTLRLVDAISRYFAECLLRAVPGVHWAVGHERPRGYVFENQPVLKGFPDALSPHIAVIIAAAHALENDPRSSPNRLLEVFDRLRAEVRQASSRSRCPTAARCQRRHLSANTGAHPVVPVVTKHLVSGCGRHRVDALLPCDRRPGEEAVCWRTARSSGRSRS